MRRRHTATRTRYQILLATSIENFTEAQRAQFLRRCAELRAAGVQFTTWDTQRNAAARLFAGTR